MNESEFEAQLRALMPAAPSAVLQKAIEEDLRPFAPALSTRRAALPRDEREGFLSRLLGGLPWAMGGAVAAVAVILCLEAMSLRTAPPQRSIARVTVEKPAPAVGRFQPEESSRQVIDSAESELVFMEPQSPARFIRVNSLERRTWADPATGARVAVELPREDLLLIPVSYQ